MNTDELATKLRDVRLLRDHARDRMRAYPSGSLMRSYWEGMHTGLSDALKTFERDLPPLELRVVRGGRADG